MKLSEITSPPFKDNWEPGERAHYEYHCAQEHFSSDAELWYRSHQPVTIMGISAEGGGKTFAARSNMADPREYRVRFEDGFTGAAYEDELYTSPEYFRDESMPSWRISFAGTLPQSPAGQRSIRC